MLAKPRYRKILGVGVEKRWSVVAWVPGEFKKYSPIWLPDPGVTYNENLRGRPRRWNYCTSNKTYVLDMFDTPYSFWNEDKNRGKKRLPFPEPWQDTVHTKRGAKKLLRKLEALKDPRLVDLHVVDIYEFINAYRKY